MGLWSRLRRTFRGSNHEDEIQEELQFHLHMDAAGGQEPRQARLRLGNMRRIEEDTRAMGIVEWIDSAFQDARYGLRQLLRTPVMVAAIVLSLTIGIGANTAIFSLLDAVLLRSLPVHQPERLVLFGKGKELGHGEPVKIIKPGGSLLGRRERGWGRLVRRGGARRRRRHGGRFRVAASGGYFA